MSEARRAIASWMIALIRRTSVLSASVTTSVPRVAVASAVRCSSPSSDAIESLSLVRTAGLAVA